MQGASMRNVAVAASAVALVVLIAVAAVSEGGLSSGLAEAQAKVGEAKAAVKPVKMTLKDLQARVSQVMNEERKEGELVRAAMMKREQSEVQLETAEDGLTGNDAVAAAASHQSIQELKDAITKDGTVAKKDKAARKKLQRELDKDLAQLATNQITAHNEKVAAKAKGTVKLAMAKQVHKTAPAATHLKSEKSKGTTSPAGKEAILAEELHQLLSLKKVRAALKQSLSENEVKIAEGVAKKLGSAWEAVPDLDPAVVAEVAVATAEKEQDIPLEADGKTPAVNVPLCCRHCTANELRGGCGWLGRTSRGAIFWKCAMYARYASAFCVMFDRLFVI